MAIINRAGLKVKFKNGCLPTEKDFCDLIDSSLIKRDDQFLGKWQSGFAYYQGDVVIHDKTLYMRIIEDKPEICDEDLDKEPDTGYCSTIPPGEDNSNWCQLQVNEDDEDWCFKKAEEGGGKSIMYDNDFDYIGIGTRQPETQLHISKENAGEFRFSCDKLNPVTYLINCRPEMTNYLLLGVDNEYAKIVSDSAHGIVFRKGSTYTDKKEIESEVNKGVGTLMHIHPEGRVGIGKKAARDFTLDVNGRIRSNGNFRIADPEEFGKGESLDSVLDNVCKMNPARFKYKNLPKFNEKPLNFYGFEASEVSEHFPDASFTDSDAKKSISYEGLVPVLFKAIQELKMEVDKLKKQIDPPQKSGKKKGKK